MKKLTVLVLFITVSASVLSQALLDSNNNWSYHFQLTVINQTHPSFQAKYSGANSLINESESKKLSVTTTLFLGRKLWKNAALYFNPEIAGGSGLSSAKGIAGFPNGEIFRIGSTDPKLYIARLYFQQNFALKNSGYAKVDPTINQVDSMLPTSRITITAGKISMADFFDNNSYSH
ncbi:MAG: carbohydrate porin, partial [Ferruginibacter sp.]|nr:carbohydrate porin [Ferruginibacter sp.]